MAASYNYAILGFAPEPSRGERLNVGVVVFGEKAMDVRVGRNLDKLRALSGAIQLDTLRELFGRLATVDQETRSRDDAGVTERIRALERAGPFVMSTPGSFSAPTVSAYEDRVETLLRLLVEPEPASRKYRPKRTHLYSDIKSTLKRARILARKNEGLESHRVVSGYEFDQGLVADLLLRNGSYHIIETADASGNEAALAKTIAEIAVSALVIERAKMKLGQDCTYARLVYLASPTLEKIAEPSLQAAEHQGVELCNWASQGDRRRLLETLMSLATPIEGRGKATPVAPTGKDLFH